MSISTNITEISFICDVCGYKRTFPVPDFTITGTKCQGKYNMELHSQVNIFDEFTEYGPSHQKKGIRVVCTTCSKEANKIIHEAKEKAREIERDVYEHVKVKRGITA